jgi:hypothetical protein
MARRREPPDSLDYFPTPPWATRALFEHVLRPLKLFRDRQDQAWEPACGEGHMSAVLEEYFATVIATDVFDYSGGEPSRWPPGWWSTLDVLDPHATTPVADWIITNPPFKTAEDFTRRLVPIAQRGVAFLVRTAWLESRPRYELFQQHPPAIVAQFAERVPMVKGRWDPEASTATSYCWVLWLKGEPTGGTILMWIPPDQRTRLTDPRDARRFAVRAEAPLLEGAAP